MTAKEFLSQARRLRLHIEQKERLLRDMKEKAMAGGSRTLSPDRVQSSAPDGSRMEAAVVEYADLEAEIEADIRAYYEKRNEIIDVIHSLGDARYVVILYEKWIAEKRMEDINLFRSDGERISLDWIKHLHSEAIRSLEKVING